VNCISISLFGYASFLLDRLIPALCFGRIVISRFSGLLYSSSSSRSNATSILSLEVVFPNTYSILYLRDEEASAERNLIASRCFPQPLYHTIINRLVLRDLPKILYAQDSAPICVESWNILVLFIVYQKIHVQAMWLIQFPFEFVLVPVFWTSSCEMSVQVYESCTSIVLRLPLLCVHTNTRYIYMI